MNNIINPANKDKYLYNIYEVLLSVKSTNPFSMICSPTCKRIECQKLKLSIHSYKSQELREKVSLSKRTSLS